MWQSGSALRLAALFVVLAGSLASVAVTRGLFDPDYFWHLAVGELILDTGSIPRTDPFSFTWSGRPWVPDQWLGELFIAGGVRVFGAAALLLVIAVIAAIGVIAVVSATAARTSWPLTIGIAVLVCACLLPQVTARPQVLSFAFAGVLLALLVWANRNTTRTLLAIPPLFLVWANTHGFFIVGLVIGATYLVATLAGRTPLSDRKWLATAIAAASLLAAAITPSGPAGILYAASFGDAGDVVTQGISEWQSPNFHNWQFIPFLGLIGALLLAGIHRAPAWLSGTAMIGAFLGLFAARSVGIGAILMVPAILAAAPRSGDSVMRGRAVVELIAAAVVAVALIVSSVARGPVSVDARRVPVTATEVLRTELPRARVLAMYEWGGYLIDKLGPAGGTVFVDGRMHKYAPDVLADYLTIVRADPGWEAVLASYPVEAMLIAPDSPLAKGPIQRAGWCEVFRNERSVLLLQTCD